MGDEVIRALDDVDVRVEAGEFVAVAGPSGSGKSTLANVIGGLDRPDSGSVLVDGRDLGRESDRDLSGYRNKRVGFIFQAFNLQSQQTALENVALPLMLAGKRRKARTTRAKECLEAVGLADRMQHRPTQLSGGQRQRVSIARALANDPAILIADEPTGSVDSRRSAEIMALLHRLNIERRLTLIVITHDLEIASSAGRLLTMQDGRLLESRDEAAAGASTARKAG